jgi:hypothetical protein
MRFRFPRSPARLVAISRCAIDAMGDRIPAVAPIVIPRRPILFRWMVRLGPTHKLD